MFLKKYNCSAAIQKTDDGGVKIFAYPGYMVGSEISKLVNRGYQQFLKTTKTEIPATADHLKALHQFSEELKEALALPSLYNESLGTVSESYQYDRIKDRDEPEVERPKRPWETVKVKAAAAAKKAEHSKASAGSFSLAQVMTCGGSEGVSPSVARATSSGRVGESAASSFLSSRRCCALLLSVCLLFASHSKSNTDYRCQRSLYWRPPMPSEISVLLGEGVDELR